MPEVFDIATLEEFIKRSEALCGPESNDQQSENFFLGYSVDGVVCVPISVQHENLLQFAFGAEQMEVATFMANRAVELKSPSEQKEGKLTFSLDKSDPGSGALQIVIEGPAPKTAAARRTYLELMACGLQRYWAMALMNENASGNIDDNIRRHCRDPFGASPPMFLLLAQFNRLMRNDFATLSATPTFILVLAKVLNPSLKLSALDSA